MGIAFSNDRRLHHSPAEEEFVILTEAMPFLLETKLHELGGNFVGAGNFQPNVQVGWTFL